MRSEGKKQAVFRYGDHAGIPDGIMNVTATREDMGGRNARLEAPRILRAGRVGGKAYVQLKEGAEVELSCEEEGEIVSATGNGTLYLRGMWRVDGLIRNERERFAIRGEDVLVVIIAPKAISARASRRPETVNRYSSNGYAVSGGKH